MVKTMRVFAACLRLQALRFRGAWARMAAVAVAALLVGGAAALAAGALLSAGAVNAPVIAVSGADGSPEVAQFASVLAPDGDAASVSFVFCAPDEARELVRTGGASAALLLPDGFAESLMTGENLPPTLVLGGRPLEDALVRLLAESAVQMLAAAQNGIGVSLRLAEDAGSAADGGLARTLNLAYALWVLGRGGVFAAETTAPTGDMSTTQHYLLCGVLYFALLAAPLLYTALGQSGQRGWLGRLRSGGWGPVAHYVTGALCAAAGYLLMLAPLMAGAAAAAGPFGLPSANVPALLPGVLACAVFLAAVAFIACAAPGILACTGLVFLGASGALYLSGGLVPPLMLPQAVQGIARFCPFTWMLHALQPVYGLPPDWPAVRALAGLAAALFAFALLALALPLRAHSRAGAGSASARIFSMPAEKPRKIAVDERHSSGMHLKASPGMKLFWAAFVLALRRLLRSPAMLVLLAAMPLAALATGLFFGGGNDGSVLVGLSVPAGSARARATADWLLAGQGMVRFAEAPGDVPLEQAVAAGEYDFGYRFAPDFDARAAEGNWRGAVTRVTTPAATFYPALDDRVASAILRACWPDFAQRALESEGYAADAGALAAQTDGLARDMELHIETAPGAAVQPGAGEARGTGLLPGVVAIFLFAYTLLAVTDFTLALRQGFFARMQPFTGAAALFAPSLAAALLPGLLAAAAALLVGFGFSAAPPSGAAGAIALLALYTLYLAGLAVLLCALCARRVFPVALVPFCVVACVVFCPFLLDAAALLPAARPVAALLPPTLFLRAVSGDAAAVLRMAGGALTLCGAGAALFWLRSHRALPGTS